MSSASASGGGRLPAVLCTGIAVEDFLFKVEHFPAPGEKLYAQALVAAPGGCSANSAIAIARLGGRARFAGPVGTDAASGRILDALTREGVDVSGVLRIDGGSVSVSGIFIDQTGEKMVATRHGDKLADAAPPDPAALVADVDLVLADNRLPNFVAPVGRAARARGIAFVLDGDRATTLDDPLLAIASHIIFSAEALRATTGLDDLHAALHHMAAHIRGFLAVTNGANDVLWLDAGNVRRMPVFAVDAIDTLGAGDTFHGGFALALAEGRDPIVAMRFGAAAAALKCTRFGGILGTPQRAEVEALLASA